MKKKISIIIPFYNEKENIVNIFKEIEELITKENKYLFEIIFMDNNSNDGSSSIAQDYVKNNPNIKYFKMSRNFGYQPNIKAGYDLCTGDAAVQLDADGEDDPKLISKFIRLWEEGNDVVYGIRKKRKEFFLLSKLRNIFYKYMEQFSDIKIPHGAGDFRLIDRKVINYLKSFEEKNLYIRGIISFIGFKQIGVEYERRKRFYGKSKISLFKYFDISFSAITSFTKTPLILIFIVGSFILFFSLLLFGFYALLFFTGNIDSPGFTTIILIQLFFFGLLIFILGVISIYIGYLLDEVKKRPTYIIDDDKK
jgi:polyisoprenyl-phosphate glycosyltransferase